MKRAIRHGRDGGWAAMGRRCSSTLAPWGAFVSLVLAAAPLQAANLNILWIVADDLGVELGCYGEPGASTPHLDRLASEGVRYTRFYTPAPVCSASRSAWMTGVHALTLRAHDHRTSPEARRPLPEGVRLLSQWFADAGYRTANLVEMPAALGFRGTGKTDWGFLHESPAFDTSRWDDLTGDKPFFAQINLREPHREFRAPAVTDPATVRLPAFYPDVPEVRADWARYLDAIAELDGKVGAILDLLDRSGRAPETVVVFFGDNGRCHARDKQFCYEGGLHVPLLIRWPTGRPVPAEYAPGATDDRLLSALDLAPTMLALAGAPVPAAMQGRVFLGEHRAPDSAYVFGARDRCDETELTLRTVRDDRYRYILNLTPNRSLMSPNGYKQRQYPAWSVLQNLAAKGRVAPAVSAFAAHSAVPEELYDLRSDPEQLINLAGDAAYAPVRDRLRAALDAWRREVADPVPVAGDQAGSIAVDASRGPACSSTLNSK
jgi:arylsulfatase A-like enzyme